MNAFCFPPPTPPSVAVAATPRRFPVHRIYCVGRNYADHVREMGVEPERAPPVFFTKPADAVVANGAAVAYPPATANLQHEIELVVAHGQPWDAAKGFDCSAPLAAIRPAAAGHPTHGRIWLEVNGVLRQESDVSQMLWDVPHIMAALSRLYELRAGDLIFTGTPAGVGALQVGDRVVGGVEGLEVLQHSVAAAATG
jgi:fumarylpyruvate hydrolase